MLAGSSHLNFVAYHVAVEPKTESISPIIMTAQFSPLSPVTMEGDIVTVTSTNTKQSSRVEECLFSLLRQLLKAVTQSVCSCQRVCDTYVLPCSCCKMSEDPMLGGNLPASGHVRGCVRRMWGIRVHVCSPKREEGMTWQEEVTRDATRRAERLKESSLRSRLRRLAESPSPAVLLVDDHVHLPGSVFRDPPVRHQQTDTCGEGGICRSRSAHSKTRTHTHIKKNKKRTHQPGCRVSLLKVTAGEVTAPRKKGDWSKSPRPLWINAASSVFVTGTHTNRLSLS